MDILILKKRICCLSAPHTELHILGGLPDLPNLTIPRGGGGSLSEAQGEAASELEDHGWKGGSTTSKVFASIFPGQLDPRGQTEAPRRSRACVW